MSNKKENFILELVYDLIIIFLMLVIVTVSILAVNICKELLKDKPIMEQKEQIHYIGFVGTEAHGADMLKWIKHLGYQNDNIIIDDAINENTVIFVNKLGGLASLSNASEKDKLILKQTIDFIVWDDIKDDAFFNNNFKPFDKVLVRTNGWQYWRTEFFESIVPSGYKCMRGVYDECIPYEGNEHLLGTTDEDYGTK